MKKIIVFLMLILLNVTFAHSGRTNAEGCHNDRKNGGYHCHNGGTKALAVVETDEQPIVATKKNSKTKKEAVVTEISCNVIAVTDGDTIKCLTADKKQIKVRLNQIDAPESKQDFGTKSKQALSDLIFGKDVIIKSAGIDRYQRTLGTIYVDEQDINLEMVKLGMAWVYTQYAKDLAYFDAEKQARIEKIGLWSVSNSVAPWEWRKTKGKK